MEENKRMGKTRDIFKKTGDIKRTFYAKMGRVKDKISKDLIKEEEIKKRWQEYTKFSSVQFSCSVMSIALRSHES